MNTIAVIVLNYKRRDNVQNIILPSLVNNPFVSTIIIAHGLRETVFGVDHTLEDKEIFREGKVLHVGDYSANDTMCCWRRWELIKRLRDTGVLKETFIHSQDDDLVFDTNTIPKLIQCYTEGNGVLISGSPCRTIINGRYAPIGVIGRCNIAIGRSIFTTIDFICKAVEKAELLKIPTEILKQDDISLSFLTLDKNTDFTMMKHYSIECKFIDLSSDHALSNHHDHLNRRNRTVGYFVNNIKPQPRIKFTMFKFN